MYLIGWYVAILVALWALFHVLRSRPETEINFDGIKISGTKPREVSVLLAAIERFREAVPADSVTFSKHFFAEYLSGQETYVVRRLSALVSGLSGASSIDDFFACRRFADAVSLMEHLDALVDSTEKQPLYFSFNFNAVPTADILKAEPEAQPEAQATMTKEEVYRWQQCAEFMQRTTWDILSISERVCKAEAALAVLASSRDNDLTIQAFLDSLPPHRKPE